MSQSIKKVSIILSLCVFSSLSNAQNCGELNSSTAHFIDNNNGTVSDSFTGLMWKKCVENNSWVNATSSCIVDQSPRLRWYDALVKAQEVNEGAEESQNFGFTNWRVPNIKELVTIADLNCAIPTIDLGLFPAFTNTLSGNLDLVYWSSTHTNRTNNSGFSTAYFADFDGQLAISQQFMSAPSLVRLVRDTAISN